MHDLHFQQQRHQKPGNRLSGSNRILATSELHTHISPCHSILQYLPIHAGCA
jgi:hypothetical protein